VRITGAHALVVISKSRPESKSISNLGVLACHVMDFTNIFVTSEKIYNHCIDDNYSKIAKYKFTDFRRGCNSLD